MNVFVGYRYYYGPNYVRKGWYQINGDLYYVRDAFAVTGDQYVAMKESVTAKRWYHFDENGVCDYCRNYDKYIKPYWKPQENRFEQDA